MASPDPLSLLLGKKKEESATKPAPPPDAGVGDAPKSTVDEVSAVLGSRSKATASSSAASKQPVSPAQAASTSKAGLPQSQPPPPAAAAQGAGPGYPSQLPTPKRAAAPAATSVGTKAPTTTTFEGMLPGEVVAKVTQTAYLLIPKPFCEIDGRVIITQYRLRFQPKKGCLREDLDWMKACGFYDIPLGAIEDLKLKQATTNTGAQENKLHVGTKDTRGLAILATGPQGLKDLMDVVEVFTAHAQPANPVGLYATVYAREQGFASELMEGWDLYDPAVEFARMGIETDDFPNAKSPWKVSSLNARYELCPTYPSQITLPRGLTAAELKSVASFRKRGRLPVMSWCGGPELQFASIWRCSQTTEGLLSSKCAEDEKLVEYIHRGTASSGAPRDLLVIDLRPWKAAYANKATGGGFEAYKNTNLVFGNIDNIHAVLAAYKAMVAAVAAVEDGSVGSWIRDVANSQWYDYVGAIISCCVQVIEEIRNHKKSVMVHCSDGWDRTAQTTSLSMLCLDAHYRTIPGFLMLIQKEWCSFGHRFRTRLALGEAKTSEYSPVFVQWLECVYQIWQQQPSAFEWTPSLLLSLATEVFSNRFGTFLCDNERERIEKVASQTLSYWSFVQSPEEVQRHRNPRYKRMEGRILPSRCQASYVVWDAFWFRYHAHGNRPKTTESPCRAPMVSPGLSSPPVEDDAA